MQNVVIDASSIVGALLRPGSIPELAILAARQVGVICLSPAVEAEIRSVIMRPRLQAYASPERTAYVLDLVFTDAQRYHPQATIADCRDAKDDKYLDLVLAAKATVLITSDRDLLVLNPWRGVAIVTPAQYIAALRQ